MEQNIAYLFLTTIPFITFVLHLIAEGLLLITVIGSSMFIFFSLYIYHASSRKETLNIIKDHEIFYFSLSDDLLFSIKMTKDRKMSDLLKETIKKEIVAMGDIVYRIDFVNFRNDILNQELNELIKECS